MTVRVYVPPTDDQLAEFIAASVEFGWSEFDVREARSRLSSRTFRTYWLARHRAAQEAAWALEDSTAGGAE